MGHAGLAVMSGHLFIYGTLDPLLAPAEVRGAVGALRRVGGGRVEGRLVDLGPYPALLAGEGQARGVVYALPADPAVLRRLDRYEGFDPRHEERSVFIRRLVRVLLDEGGELTAWAYLYNREPGEAPLVPGGDYLAWRLAAGKQGDRDQGG